MIFKFLMGNSLIISRFNENLNWLENFSQFNILIYNKGKKLPNNSFRNIININNVGRESQTWLYHIFNNYENLDETNIFLQGRIDDLGCMAFQDPSLYLKEIDKYGFVASRYGILGPLHWDKNVGVEKDKRYKKDWDSGKISKSKLGFRKFAKTFFPDIPIFVTTSYGGCFAVKKELIQIYKKDFYAELLEILSRHKNPIEGHYLERLWCYMFTKNIYFTKSIKDVIKTKIERNKFSLFNFN